MRFFETISVFYRFDVEEGQNASTTRHACVFKRKRVGVSYKMRQIVPEHSVIWTITEKTRFSYM